MWKPFVLFYFAVLHRAVYSTVPSPVNVNFSSVNLRNVLQWQPGNGTPSDRFFTVQYAIYGDSLVDSKGRRVRWRAVQRCTGIVQCQCDLSNEMWDVEQGYFARVRSTAKRGSSKWAVTRRFDPKSDTSFGAPVLSIKIENNSAIITMKGPIRYQPNHEKPEIHMATLYPQMMYNLSIYNTRRSKVSNIIVNSNLYKHALMEYATEYCFAARSKFLSMPIECQSSVWHCITTPADPLVVQLQLIILSTIIPVVFMCVLVLIIYLLYHYLNGSGQETPSFLNTKFTSAIPPTIRPERTTPISLYILKDFKDIVSEAPNPFPGQTIKEPPPLYAPQIFPAPADAESSWKDETSYYGVLAVDSNQRHQVSEVDKPILGRQATQGSVCSNYASQNFRDLPIILDCSLDTYGMVGLAACAAEKNEDEQEEDEEDEETSVIKDEEISLISWDPQTRRLMLPNRDSALNRGLNMAPQEVEEQRSAAVCSSVLLESVFVKQSSEEAAEAQTELGTGVATGSKMEHFLSGWGLVFATDE